MSIELNNFQFNSTCFHLDFDLFSTAFIPFSPIFMLILYFFCYNNRWLIEIVSKEIPDWMLTLPILLYLTVLKFYWEFSGSYLLVLLFLSAVWLICFYCFYTRSKAPKVISIAFIYPSVYLFMASDLHQLSITVHDLHTFTFVLLYPWCNMIGRLSCCGSRVFLSPFSAFFSLITFFFPRFDDPTIPNRSFFFPELNLAVFVVPHIFPYLVSLRLRMESLLIYKAIINLSASWKSRKRISSEVKYYNFLHHSSLFSSVIL